ncbi:MAG: hypothetical protein M3Y75_04025 [Actinomycetota bacterium]|nr:hypothetical protein [Actinomycetota bacterium]
MTGVVGRGEALGEAVGVAGELERVAVEVLVEGAPEGLRRQLAERLVAGLQLGVGGVPVGEEGGDRADRQPARVEMGEAFGVLAHHAGGGLGDLVLGHLGEDLEVAVADPERLRVGAHQGRLPGVGDAVGERHHRQHPHRPLGLLGAVDRGGERRRLDRRQRVYVDRIEPQHDRAGADDRFPVHLGRDAAPVLEGDFAHRAEDGLRLRLRDLDQHAARLRRCRASRSAARCGRASPSPPTPGPPG